MRDYAKDFDESGLPDEACAVYIMSADKDGPIKIGVSNRPRLRLSQLQVGHPGEITIAAVCWMTTRASALMIEKWFLKLLAKRGLNGEWLDMAPFEIAELLGPIVQLFAYEHAVVNGSYSAWVSPPTKAQRELYAEQCPVSLIGPNTSTTLSPTAKN